jgi:hypothetical protein
VLTARCHSTQSGGYPRYAELPIHSLTHTLVVTTVVKHIQSKIPFYSDAISQYFTN